MTPPGARKHGISPELPKSPERLRAVEPTEVERAPRTPQRPPNNLPLELSSFVGREKELAEVRLLLENNRLLTLTGSGVAAKRNWPWRRANWCRGSGTACGWWSWRR